MSKLVPSPDWFVGVDSLDMCNNHQFVDQLSRHLDPHDGGTDNGFTFTSPNWPTQPRGVIFAISSQYPTHPAGSFFYPHLDKLPSIATIKFKKVELYIIDYGVHYPPKISILAERIQGSYNRKEKEIG